MKRCCLLLCVALLSSCAILPGGKPAVSRNVVYLLETRLPASEVEAKPGCHVVVVNPPENAPGHTGRQMLYQRNPNQIERFAFSRWAASPAVMIEPLLLDALRRSNRYDAVLASPAPVRADLRIENDNLWLIQRFDGEGSYIELRMSSQIYVPVARRLIASQDFSYREQTGDATPAGGVLAAERAVQRLLRDFREFVGEAAHNSGYDCVASD